MKHFLDLGTHKFEGLISFISQYKIDSSWKIQCFEANPIIYDQALSVMNRLGQYDITFHNKAIMDQSGSITINCRVGAYVDGVYKEAFTMGSTVLDTPVAEKINERNQHMVFEYVAKEVEALDINVVMDELCERDPEAEIYIKCDIEAAEFVVLPRLLTSEHIGKVKDIHIEWHERFWTDPEEHTERVSEKRDIENQLNGMNIRYFRHG
jgi:FkbM family methyltransferase